jgi:ribokinase
MTDRPRLAVVGAVNVDLVVTVERLPGPGETMTHGTFARHHGGKGGNQAVAAARVLGDAGVVVMICSVGDDDLGTAALDALRTEGIGIEPADPTSDRPTGVALILVDARGENQIAVAPGANERLRPDSVTDALDRSAPTVVLGSLEVPPDAVTAAATWCAQHDVPFVLNPAPMNTDLVASLRDHIAYITPNEHELEQLGDASQGPTVIETRGPDGVILHGTDDEEHIGGPSVEAVDTTGAGDCFNGVFAAGLAEGRPLRDSVKRAIAAAAMSVTVAGAREGMPTRRSLDEHIAR